MRDHAAYESDAAVAADLAQRALNPAERTFDTPKGRAIILREDDGSERVRLVDEVMAEDLASSRIVQAVTVETEESLVTYARRFKSGSSLLLASIASNSIVAVLDYHAARNDDAGDPVAEPDMGFDTAHGGHTASLKLPFSLEWSEWTGKDGKLLPQLDFVRFLEENREDIRSPDAATVLEACRDLQALKRVDFRSVVREDSENYRIEYEEETDTRSKKGDVTLPSEFVLSIPVYFDGEEVEVIALLRWKLDDNGGLTLGFKLKRAERIRQAVFKGIVTGVAEATGVPAVYGKLG